MGAKLTEGATYTIKATTTNKSTKAGVPVAATLSISIAAVVDSQIIMDDSDIYNFGAEETHVFVFPMTTPVGTGGKSGAVVATILDPMGNKLADGRLDIDIQAIVIPSFTFSNVSARLVTLYDAPAWSTIVFNCRATNPTNATLTRTIYLMHRYDSGTWHIEWSFDLTLAPGQGYDFVWDGNTFGQRDPSAYNGPLIGKGKTHCMKLRDEYGNESAQACVTG